jgi:arylsulfatase A-like enzyme
MRLWIAVVALAVLGAAILLLVLKEPGLPGRPNFLLVTLDTTRADRLGCYGHDRAKTPRIDALAREGVRFNLAVAQAAVTPVSHASILTGLYPFQHGLRVIYGGNCFRLEEGRHPTLAALLKENGWNTAAFVSAFTASEYFGLHQGFDVFDTGLKGDLEKKMRIYEGGRANWAVDRNQRRADATTNRALEWLEQNPEPFFLWLHYFDPHDGLLAPPPKFSAPFLKGANTREDWTRALYDAEVAFMDRQLGRILDHLKEEGLYENTLIVVTSDHGEGLGDHDWWFHHILYQEQLRMPLILRLPDGPGDRVVDDLVRSIDVMPTLLEYAEIPLPSMAGKSLMNLVRGEPEKARIAYADALLRLDDNRSALVEDRFNDLFYCILSQGWKLTYRRFDPGASELYCLDRDPGELKNVIKDFPEKREELLSLIQRPGVMIESLIPPPPDDDAAKRLKDMGY